MAAYSSFIPKSMGKEKNSHSAVEKPEKYTLLQPGIKVPTDSDKSQWQCVVRMALHLYGGFRQNPQPQCNHEKHIRPSPSVVHSSKYLTSTPQYCQGHQKQEKSEKLSQPRGVQGRHDN